MDQEKTVQGLAQEHEKVGGNAHDERGGKDMGPFDEVIEALSMKDRGQLSRSEVLNLPIIRKAYEGDPDALEYLKEWGQVPTAPPNDEGDPEKMTFDELASWEVGLYNYLITKTGATHE